MKCPQISLSLSCFLSRTNHSLIGDNLSFCLPNLTTVANNLPKNAVTLGNVFSAARSALSSLGVKKTLILTRESNYT